jgi:choline-sulfatase
VNALLPPEPGLYSPYSPGLPTAFVRPEVPMRWFWTITLVILVAPLAARAAEPRRPNVLWICADDHAPYVCGAYGNTQVRTPHLDRLAAQGMRFDRAYCNSPVCTASRQSFITGRYPRAVGVTLLQTALPASEKTLGKVLKAAGYDTAAIGKMHFNSALKHGFDLRLDRPDHQAYLRKKGKLPLPANVEVLPVWKPFRDPARVWLNSFYRPFGARDSDMDGTYFANEAARYLAEKKTRPFFLIVSFYEPHSPFRFPVEYRGRHKPESFAVPKVGPEDDWQIPAIFRGLTPREKQGIIASYYTSTEFMDKNVGVVLDALRKAGLDRDTLVVYTGDHGYMLGQHGRFEKHCCYEQAVRAPLLVRFPGRIREKQASKALVEFIDIVPTVLEFCRVPVPRTVQGRSLVPLVTGKAAAHRDHVVAEYSENEEAMIRTARWKFIYSTGKRARKDGYATGRPLPGRTIQLFDLEQDPQEMKNLAKVPKYAALVKQFTAQLADHMKRTARQPELVPKTDDVHAILEYCLQPHDVVPPKKADGKEKRSTTPEERALAYLAREVPRWAAKNKCYSCHNNGDAARALYAAARQGFAVPAKALADTTRWLTQPEKWEHNGGEGEFNDKKLARLQFAAGLAGALDAGHTRDRKALAQAARMLTTDQHKDGSWRMDARGNIGSPATYGTALATYLARHVLHEAGPESYGKAVARADRWFRQAEVVNVLDAGAVLLGLGDGKDAEALAQRKKCLALLRKGQSRDGGWGPYVTAAAEPFDTAVVLLALCRVPERADHNNMIRRGRAYLIAAQEEDGSWPETTRPAGRTSYAQHISTAGWATLALLATR